MSEESKDINDLYNKYKEKGLHKVSLAEYESARREKIKRKSKFKIPIPVQFILGTPFFIIFCCGIFFLPYILYLIITSPSSSREENDTEKTTSRDTKDKER